MKATGMPHGKYPIIARLFDLINHISEDQLILILKELLKEKFSSQLFKLIIDMSDEQHAALLRHLQKKDHAIDNNERRGYSRKACLIPLTYVVQDRQFDGYILDISDHGVFIETGNVFFSGQEIIMTFLAPGFQKPLKITGEIVWSSQNGIGVKFNQLTAHQHKAITEFSKSNAEVIKIRS
ncbi:MAG: PilZ domain-containing protein [Desulfobacterales bacterium]|jgi:Tfp pilus assembly protein PilZ